MKPDTGSTDRTSRTQLAITLFAVMFLFAPGAAFVVGKRGAPIENRASTPFTGVDDGWKSFESFGRFVADRTPLRSRAVRTDAFIDEHVFNEDPAFGGSSTPRVIKGDNGFLFFADAVDDACDPHSQPPESTANLARFSQIVEDSGRPIVTMVAPDKSSVHPELMPADLPKRECFTEYDNELWSLLNQQDIRGFYDLRAALRTESADSREPLYLRKDSHWDSAGSLVAVEAMVNAFAPGLWDPNEVKFTGTGEYTGDLTNLQGKPEVDQAPLYVVDRPYVTNVSTEVLDNPSGGVNNRRFVNTAPPGKLIPGKTVMFLDSFGLVSLTQIVPFFEDLTVYLLVDFNADRYTELITESDRVWLMTVQRSTGYRLKYEVGSPEFHDQLEAELPRAGQ
jgi:alginate O-acetyltransferase complex protein AlgJ